MPEEKKEEKSEEKKEEKPAAPAEKKEEVKEKKEKPKEKKEKPKGKSNQKNKYLVYEVSGESINRKRKHCPRCGPGIFMAEHQTRTSCGKCGYTEFSNK